MRFLKMHHCLVAALFTLSGMLSAAQASIDETKASYLTIQVPGALGTYPMALNNSMAVTGYYMVSPTVADGFLQDAAGVITTFSIRGSMWTEPESINTAGDITGFYEIAAGDPLGFIRYANGRIVTFIAPCKCSGPGENSGAQPVSINDYGRIAGNYPAAMVGSPDGFGRSPGGAITEYVFQDDNNGYPTVVTGLNPNGTIVGFSSSNYFLFYASSFILDPDGFYTEFAINPDTATIAEAINEEGTIAGWYNVCNSVECDAMGVRGFVRSPQGAFALFTPPGTIVVLPESAPAQDSPPSEISLSAPHRMSINQAGVVTGSYTDSNQAQHGFVREASGPITSFDPPRGKQTTATSINVSGTIAGSFYYDWNAQVPVGFLRIPER